MNPQDTQPQTGDNQLNPDQVRSALGFATMLQEQHLKSQQPQPQTAQNAQPQQTQPKQEDIGKIVQDAVKEAISGLRNDIKKVLDEDTKEDGQKE